MVLEKIQNGICVISLAPEEAALLHHSCDLAVQDIGNLDKSTHIETLGAAFKAMAIAGIAQGEMHVEDLELLQKELLAQGLAA